MTNESMKREGEPKRLLPEVTQNNIAAANDYARERGWSPREIISNELIEIKKRHGEKVTATLAEKLQERLVSKKKSAEAHSGIDLSVVPPAWFDMAYQLGIAVTHYFLRRQSEANALDEDSEEPVLPLIFDKTLNDIQRAFPGLTALVEDTRRRVEQADENQVLFRALKDFFKDFLDNNFTEGGADAYSIKLFLRELFEEAMYFAYGLLRFQAEQNQKKQGKRGQD